MQFCVCLLITVGVFGNMSAHLYTSIHGQLVRISALPGPNIMDSHAVGDYCNLLINTDKIERTLLAESFQFSTKSGRFEPRGKNVALTLDASSDMRFLASAKVIDSRTGLNIPCIVVEQRGSEKNNQNVSSAGTGVRPSQLCGTYQISTVFLFLRRRKFVVRGFFHLAYSLKSTKLFLCDGPTMCWEHQGRVYITRAFSVSNHTQVDVMGLDECLWKASNSLKWFGVRNGEVVAMGTALSSEQAHSSGDVLCDLGHKWTVVKQPVQKTEVSNAPITDENAAMPHEYSNIVNCVHFYQCSISQSGSRCLGGSDLGIATNSDVVLAATIQFQLIEASGGIVRRVCSLPFNDACKIAVATVTGEELVVVHSRSGRVCALRSKSFEVAKEWTGFHTVLVDDFLFSGAEQVLLLGLYKDAPQNNFHLTDLGTCNWTTKESEDVSTCKVPVCAGNLQSAVQALETQIQTGMASLRFSESQCNLKSQLIKQSQDALYKMAKQLPSFASPAPCTSLICLCDLSGKDRVEETSDENVSMNQDAALRCLCGWQRVVVDHWIVGIDVKNQTDRPVSDVCVSLIPASTTQTSLCSATSTCHFNSVASFADTCSTSSRPGPAVERTGNHGEPFGKRMKLDQNHHDRTAILYPGQTTTVIGVTGIPAFTSQPVSKCNVILTWREPIPSNRSDVTTDEDEVGSAADKDECVERRRTCGTAVLHASDVVTERLMVNPLDPAKSASECQRDIQALDALQLATPLLLTSKHSHLKCVEGILTGCMGFQCLAVHEGMISPSGALGMARVKIVSRDGPSKMGLTVYSRNQSDLLLFCQHLYQLLPDDVIIKPLPPVNQIRSALATTMRAIDKELQAVLSHLQQLLVDQSLSMLQGHSAQDTTADGSKAGTSSEDKRDKVRGDFEREKRKWCNADVMEVGASGDARNLRQDLLDLRKETDVDVLNLASLLSIANFSV